MTDQLNRNVKIFKVDMTDYARQKKQRDQIQDSFYDLSLTDLGFEQRCKTAEANKMRTFRTTTMREADIPKIGNEFTTIRIRFPDDFILQGDFQAKEKLAAVREFIREQIAYPDGDFELLMVGSGGKLSDPSKTLKAYKLCPNILLIFKYTDVTENELKSAHLPKRYLKDVPMPVINHKNVLPQGFYRKDVPKPGFNYSWRSVPAVRKRGKSRMSCCAII